MLAELGLTHFELNTPLEYRAEDLTDDELSSTLAAANEVGLGVFLTDHRVFTAMSDLNEKSLAEYVARWSSFPAVAGYYVWDEPRREDFAAVKRIHDCLRSLDPSRLPLVALLPSYGDYHHPDDYRDYVTTFVNLIDPPVLSFDFYPCRRDEAAQVDIVWPDFLKDLQVFWEVSRDTGKPFWYYAACCDWTSAARASDATIGLQVWTAVAFGASGIQYFLARDFHGGDLELSNTPIVGEGRWGPTADAVKAVNAGLRVLWGKLAGSTPTGVSWGIAEEQTENSATSRRDQLSPGVVVSEWTSQADEEPHAEFVVNANLDHACALPAALNQRRKLAWMSPMSNKAKQDLDKLELPPGGACLLVRE